MTATERERIGQGNSALGLMGLTGAGKTSLIATAAEYAYENYRKIMLLYSFAGGGIPSKAQALVRLGIIRLWRARTRGEAFETTIRASQGWWPAKINAATGETAPGVKLVPPITQRLTLLCPQGHVVKVVGFAHQLTPAACPQCKTHTTLQNGQVLKEQHRTKGFEQVGVVAFDDITSMLNWQMEDMAARHANQEIKGEETALGGRIHSGELKLGGNNRSHYGFVQTRASEMVHNSNGIPGLVLPPIWTGLTLETVDEGGMNVVGLKLAGKAKTDEAGAWFGNMLEVSIEKDEAGNDVRRLSLSEFVDAQGRKHLIKHRGSPKMPPYLQDAPGEPWTQVHLGVFFDMLDKDVAENAQAAQDKFGDAPGVPDGEMEYGDGEVPALTGTPAAAATAAAPAGKVAAPVVRPGRRPATPPRTMKAPEPAAPAAPVAEGPKEEEPPLPLEGADNVVQPQESQVAEPTPAEPTTVAAPAPVAEASSTSAPTPAAPPAPAPAPRPPVAAAPGARPMAPPPGPRPPAVAPRRPPRPATPPVPVGAKS